MICMMKIKLELSYLSFYILLSHQRWSPHVVVGGLVTLYVQGSE